MRCSDFESVNILGTERVEDFYLQIMVTSNGKKLMAWHCMHVCNARNGFMLKVYSDAVNPLNIVICDPQHEYHVLTSVHIFLNYITLLTCHIIFSETEWCSGRDPKMAYWV